MPEKKREGSVRVVIIAIILIAALSVAVSQYFGVPADTPFEQCIEKVIEHQTGLDIDLSPQE
jgi:hypothetical protein